jgi:glycosyltransferase involved in cell wall biosynthesis
MDVPEVSIIIPTFNRARFLAGAVDSALAQGSGVEVIVVDDGSTDGTDAILASFGERIRVLDQPNRGPGAARNLGAEQAAGEFLFFLDSDDLLQPGAIRKLLTAARKLGPGKVPFGHAMTIDAAGEPTEGPIYGFPLLSAGHALQLADLLGGIMPLCLVLFPRDRYIEFGGLRYHLRFGEDHEFALRLHKAGMRFVATEVSAIQVRLHDDPRLSSDDNREHGLRLLELWRTVAELVEGAPDFDPAARKALAKVVWVAGRDAARGRARAEARDLFALAQGLFPAVGSVNPVPLRLAAWLAGPYCAERMAELVKAVLRRR